MAGHEAYKWFIDNLVDVALHRRVSDRLQRKGQMLNVRHEAIAPDADEQALAQALDKLTADEKALVAGFIDETRRRAVHDVAGFLGWAMSEANMTITLGTQSIPVSPYATMHHDFINRCDGSSWPDAQTDVAQ